MNYAACIGTNSEILSKFDIPFSHMPLLDTIHCPDGTAIYLWQIAENVDELVRLCLLAGVPAVDVQCCEKRAIEKLAVSLLVHHAFGSGVEFGHTPAGAPVVAGSNVSVSHTLGLACVARNDCHRIGVDIERCSPRVLRVRGKFLNAGELATISAEDVVANTLAWTAKEALYKLFGGAGGASLSRQYAVGRCEPVDGELFMRSAAAECLPGEGLAVVSQLLAGDVALSLALEAKYI